MKIKLIFRVRLNLVVIIKSVVEMVGVLIKIVLCVINKEGMVKFDIL